MNEKLLKGNKQKFFILFLLFFTIQLNADWTNNFYLCHGVQAAVIGICVINKPYLKKDFFICGLAVYYSLLLISSLWSADVSQSLVYIVYILAINIPVIFIYNWMQDSDDLNVVMKAYVIASAINGVYLVVKAGWFTYLGNLTPGLFYWAANTTSKHYAIAVVFLLMILSKEKSRVYKILWMGILVEFAYVLIYCGSRGALILVAASLLMTMITKEEPLNRKIIKIGLYVGAIAIVYSLFMNNEMLFSIIGKRFAKFSEAYSEGGLIGAEGERTQLIQAGLELFSNRPFLGYGYNGFIQNTSFGLRNLYSHNDYIECMVELGIIGFITYYSLYVRMLSRAKFLCKRINGSEYSLLVGCLIGIIIFNMVSITRYDIANMSFIAVYIMAWNVRKIEFRQVECEQNG